MGEIPVAAEFLSIREVLDELVAEFSDITISKIRFLESRGLIHPERTPSGYRKFYSNDVERLRWILRQQRENFLPLKVIKRRLDLEDGKTPDLPDSPSLFDDECEDPAETDALAYVVSNIRQVAQSVEEESPRPGEQQRSQAAVNDTPSARHEFSETAAAKPLLSAVPSPKTVTLDGEDVPSYSGAHDGTKHPNHPSQIEAKDDSHPDADPPGETLHEKETVPGSSSSSERPAESKRVREGSGPPAPPGPVAPDNDLNDLEATFSIDELAIAAATNVESIAELEEFGFINSSVVAGIPCFDHESLKVAGMIVSLRTFGIEPRHLKSIRHAAERDASLYGQAVAPLLRQRNPDARARAKSQLEELATTGSALYDHILRSELRKLTGA